MATSNAAQLTVTQNTLPAASITQPVSGTTYAGGNVINYAGTGNDAEDGVLPASAFTWWVNLHHDSHIHPHVLPVTGSKTGSFTIPIEGETSANVFYRIHLRVRDSGGLTRSVSRDIRPRKVTVTLATNPAGLQLRLDGQPVSRRTASSASWASSANSKPCRPRAPNWVFSSWSDGGARIHTISTPTANTTYTARFVGQSAVSIAIGNRTRYEGDSGTAGATFAVRLSAPRTVPVTVAWKTTDGSAKAGSDYNAASGSLSFPPGTTLRTIPIGIRGDTALETSEIFYVDLSAPSGASIADPRGIGTILNDDG